MADRPFKVLGIQQIAIGGLDKSKLSRLWIDTLGLTLTGNFRSERENVDEDIAAIGSGPFKVEVDLMQPIDPGKAPKVHEPQLNHIGLWIDNLAAAVVSHSAQNTVNFALIFRCWSVRSPLFSLILGRNFRGSHQIRVRAGIKYKNLRIFFNSSNCRPYWYGVSKTTYLQRRY